MTIIGCCADKYIELEYEALDLIVLCTCFANEPAYLKTTFWFDRGHIFWEIVSWINHNGLLWRSSFVLHRHRIIEFKKYLCIFHSRFPKMVLPVLYLFILPYISILVNISNCFWFFFWREVEIFFLLDKFDVPHITHICLFCILQVVIWYILCTWESAVLFAVGNGSRLWCMYVNLLCIVNDVRTCI